MCKLTEKQKRFCDEYLACLNATQAAIKAGYKEKYAATNTTKLLNNTNVKEYIEKRLAEKESELIATQDEVMKYLTAVMRREKTEHVVVTLSKETSKYEDDGYGTMRKKTVKEEIPQVVEIPARLMDSNKAAELLGKAYAMFTDKVGGDVDLNLNITVDYGEEKE